MSSQRIISYALDDLVVDPDGAIDALNDACTHRQVHYRVSGICQLEHRVYFALAPVADPRAAGNYLLVTVEDTSHDGFVSMLDDRWAAGFDIVGTITLYETVMALFARPPERK